MSVDTGIGIKTKALRNFSICLSIIITKFRRNEMVYIRKLTGSLIFLVNFLKSILEMKICL